MAAITTRPGIGSDATVYIGSDNRTSWFDSFDPGVTFDTAPHRPLGQADTLMIQTGRGHTFTAELNTITEALDYFDTWAYGDLNDEREFKYRREGDGPGKPELELDLILADYSGSTPADGKQTRSVTFEVSQTPSLGTQ